MTVGWFLTLKIMLSKAMVLNGLTGYSFTLELQESWRKSILISLFFLSFVNKKIYYVAYFLSSRGGGLEDDYIKTCNVK